VIYKIIIHTLFPYYVQSCTGLDVRKGRMGNIFCWDVIIIIIIISIQPLG